LRFWGGDVSDKGRESAPRWQQKKQATDISAARFGNSSGEEGKINF